ncbi:MAG: hypothetical protein AAF573_14375 [Bacteroidota bacterium]
MTNKIENQVEEEETIPTGEQPITEADQIPPQREDCSIIFRNSYANPQYKLQLENDLQLLVDDLEKPLRNSVSVRSFN